MFVALGVTGIRAASVVHPKNREEGKGRREEER
jgi:hypothetical protein